MSSSLNKRTNPPPRLELTQSNPGPESVVLTTPDITNTVTTPGMIDIMTKNGLVVSSDEQVAQQQSEGETFNQFSLSTQLQSGMVMTAPQTITTQIEHR